MSDCGKLEDYIPFIKKHSVGMEGSSCWIWWKSGDEIWESKGYAANTIEESLFLLQSYVKMHVNPRG